MTCSAKQRLAREIKKRPSKTITQMDMSSVYRSRAEGPSMVCPVDGMQLSEEKHEESGDCSSAVRP